MTATAVGATGTSVGAVATTMGVIATVVGVVATAVGAVAISVGAAATEVGVTATEVGMTATAVGVIATAVGTTPTAWESLRPRWELLRSPILYHRVRRPPSGNHRPLERRGIPVIATQIQTAPTPHWQLCRLKRSPCRESEGDAVGAQVAPTLDRGAEPGGQVLAHLDLELLLVRAGGAYHSG